MQFAKMPTTRILEPSGIIGAAHARSNRCGRTIESARSRVVSSCLTKKIKKPYIQIKITNKQERI